MYFMPIIVGFSCGKIFDCNPYTTAAIGAALVYPNLVAAIAAEGGITFLHIPVSTTTYANTLFPIILASFFASKVEKLAKKVLPEMIQLMMVPTVVLALTVPLSYLVIGPVMQYVSNGLSTVVCGKMCIRDRYTGICPLYGATQIPWTCPPIISGFLLAGWKSALLQLVILCVSFFVYPVSYTHLQIIIFK